MRYEDSLLPRGVEGSFTMKACHKYERQAVKQDSSWRKIISINWILADQVSSLPRVTSEPKSDKSNSTACAVQVEAKTA